jgi:hypothetical protein
MADQARQRQLAASLEAVLREEPGARRYRRRQVSIRRRKPGRTNGAAHERDANRLWTPKRTRNFVERVARLLNPL